MGPAINKFALILMDIYFNELSIQITDHPESAKQLITNLLNVYISLQKLGIKGLKTTSNLLSEHIAPNYTFSTWLSDSTVDIEARRLFRSRALQLPFIEEVLDRGSRDDNRIFEFKYDDHVTKGLGAAYLFDSLSISLNSSEQWDRTSIEIFVRYYSEDEDIVEADKIVNHCSKLTHINALKNWIEQTIKPYISNGKLLWLKRKEFFPHLIFCDGVEDQISNLGSNDSEFAQIRKRLFELNRYCAGWVSGPFDFDQIPSRITPESESRISRYRQRFTFLTPAGDRFLFSWHARFTPGAGRIHFYPDEQQRLIYIGYIGPKIN